ncbi:hypothetical protein [Bacillus sp. FJAT-49736]|uniref:hypothetical protein n=1 Tax=Bacillus sp. FJAT-49736 TaxID=2833582 RepID=UPI001BC9C0C0|nr:hypothetical protein [Bacillus sp. FJAT-49736]MBS4175223.1 hypothetical protein [Bacillus sp. FJAT-49736]
MKRIPNDYEMDDHEISDLLKNFTIETPTEHEISKTIEELRFYVPKRRKTIQSYLSQTWNMLFYSFNPVFIFLSLVVYIIGIGVNLNSNYSPYFTLLVISPTPFLFGLFELVKGRELKMWELEQACKYSAKQLLLAKLTLISGVNIGFNILFCILAEVTSANLVFWKLTVFWIIPLCFVSSISLLLSLKFRGWSSLVVLPVLWFGISFMLQQIPGVMTFFESVHWTVYACLILFSVSIFNWQIRLIKRGIHIEANYS